MVTDYIFFIISLFIVVLFICKSEIKIEKFENNGGNILEDAEIQKYAKLYYDYPVDINNTYKKFDKSVLRNSRVIKEINTYSQEIKASQVDKIIKQISKKNNIL